MTEIFSAGIADPAEIKAKEEKAIIKMAKNAIYLLFISIQENIRIRMLLRFVALLFFWCGVLFGCLLILVC